MREDLKERWAEGGDMSGDDHAIAMTFGDILNLNYKDDIEPYYQVETPIEDDDD